MIKRLFITIAMALVAAQAPAADLKTSLPNGSDLVIQLPAGWKNARQPGPVPTINLTPTEGNAFHVQLSVLVKPDGSMAPTDPESIRRKLDDAVDEAIKQSVEKSLPIQTLRSGNVRGQYFSATDRNEPKAGEFKHLTQGLVSVQGLPVTFTILSNGAGQAAVVEAALNMLKAARRE